MVKILKISIVLFFLFFVNSNSQIVINELMPAPMSDEPEWIELYNYSDSSFINKNFIISNQNTAKKISNITVLAKAFTILTSDTTKFLTKRKLPLGALLFQAAIPTLHNTYDPYVLRNEDSTVIDSVYYDMDWGTKGISFERIDYLLPATDRTNLTTSVSPDSATAGYLNSVALKDYDFQLSCFKIRDHLSFSVRNSGRYPLSDLKLKISVDKNRDGNFSDDEIFSDENLQTINRRISKSYYPNISDLYSFAGKYGLFNLLCTVYDDGRNLQRTCNSEIFVSYPWQTIVINEFLFDEDSLSAEFVELYNKTNEEISLEGFSLTNRVTKTGHDTITINSSDYSIAPNGYFVIFWDSLFLKKFPQFQNGKNCYFRLSNMNLKVSSDAIYFFDANGNMQDSVPYTGDWASKDLFSANNISIERISPSLPSNLQTSWASCGDKRGATPGEPNSVSFSLVSDIILSAEPNPFSPVDVGNKQMTTITYKLPYRTARINCKIYTTAGEPVKELINDDYTSPLGFITWDGKDSDGRNVPIGPYVLLLEATDTVSGDTKQGKMVIVVGS